MHSPEQSKANWTGHPTVTKISTSISPPPAMAGTGIGPTDLGGNANRLSGLVALLPYLEQSRLWEQISTATTIAGVDYPAMGPAPWVEDYPPWQTQLPTLLCPSWPEPETKLARTNYAFCIGDVSLRKLMFTSTDRGAFACGMFTKLSSITDGISNTIALAEIGNRQDRLLSGQVAINQPAAMLDAPIDCLGLRNTRRPTEYAEHTPSTLVAVLAGSMAWPPTVCSLPFCLPIVPVAPQAVMKPSTASTPAAAWHGGATCVFVDGSVHFISDNVDTGD